ncbi:terminase small subunit [Clostridium cadaveris]|uniref:terminase small subunit n=1 Tax=Clostridium cadaveris TaxID=1529 RepID=UPI000C07F24A|nr:terminase small subunit [Clostridium cadaveris]MDM8312850.1 terminase small subunit [Clostridium cadaveris]
MINIEDDELKEKILRGLKLKRIRCPICNTKSWEIIKVLENVTEKNHGDKIKYSYEIPMTIVRIICERCGYICEFNSRLFIQSAEYEQSEYSGWPTGIQGDENQPLDEKQKKFVEEYIKCEERKEAAFRAGYGNLQTIDAIATKLMSSAKVIKAIKEEKEKILNEDI